MFAGLILFVYIFVLRRIDANNLMSNVHFSLLAEMDLDDGYYR